MSLAERMYDLWGSESDSPAARLTLLPSLSSEQIDCLKQLVTPVYDGNLMSKSTRSQLVDMGLVSRWNGLNFATQDGYVVLDTLTDLHGTCDRFKGGIPWETYKKYRR